MQHDAPGTSLLLLVNSPSQGFQYITNNVNLLMNKTTNPSEMLGRLASAPNGPTKKSETLFLESK